MMKTISQKAMLKKTAVRLIAILMSAVMAALSVPAVHANAAEKSEPTITFPLPKKSNNKKYTANVFAKYSNGTSHDSYLGGYVLKTGKTSLPFSVVDIGGAPEGTKVYAVADGVVKENNNHSSGGYNVVIKHNDGSYSYYGHLQKRSTLKKGTKVSSGDLIGYVGQTGAATGPHLHFEWSGHDPYCYFKDLGYIKTANNSGASKYPHKHEDPYTARVKNTDGSLAINPGMKAKNPIGYIPENAKCTVYPDKSSSKWYYISYNGAEGYSYYKYLIREKEENTESNEKTTVWKESGGIGAVSTQPSQVTTSPQVAAPSQTTTTTAKEVPPIIVNSYTAYVTGTDGSLVINSRNSPGYGIAEIPEGAACTVYPDQSTGNWLYVSYNGIEGYSYGKYLTKTVPSTYWGRISGTDGSLMINSRPAPGYGIAEIPEGEYCKVYDGVRSGNWVWVEYNGIFGYSYSKYIK